MGKTFGKPLSQQQNPNRVELIRKPGLDLLEKDEVKTKRPSMWNIVFYNDDYTPMDFVEFVLKTVFHISTLDVLALTLAVHTKGKGIAGTYTFEVAEEKQSEVLLMVKIEEHPLRVGSREGLTTSRKSGSARCWVIIVSCCCRCGSENGCAEGCRCGNCLYPSATAFLVDEARPTYTNRTLAASGPFTPFRSETGGIRGFQSLDLSVNRTAVN
jgi:ATP-dependent Clp protease adaptor protein ClpS